MRKKILVGIVAVGIAVMLVALPYESNAIVPLVGLALGLAVGGVVFGSLAWWITHKNNDDHVHFSTNWTAYRNGWLAQWETWDNEIKTTSNYAKNTVNMLNNTDLYYIRYAERKGLEYLNVSNFTTIEDKVVELLDEDFKSTYKFILHTYLPILRDIYLEVNGIYSLSTSDIRYVMVGGNAVTLSKSQEATRVLKWFIWIGDYGNLSASTFDNDFNDENKIIDNINDTKIIYHWDWQNDTLSAILQKPIWIVFCKADGTYYCVNANYFYNNVTVYKRKGTIFEQGTQTGFSICTLDGSCAYWHPTRWDLNVIRGSLYSTYDRIRNSAITESRTLWQTYKDAGYNDISQLPEDEIPIFPDIVMDNIEALGNMSLEDAYALYWNMLKQLPNAVLLNKTNVTGNDFKIANYSGKIATITLIKANATAVMQTIIDKHKCYIIPLEAGITLSVNHTYAIYDNSSLGSIENVIKTHFNVTKINAVFTQQFLIFDINTSVWYNIKPSHSYAYGFYVYALTKNNKSVDTINLPINTFNDFVYSRYGFRFNPFTYNPHIPITIHDDGSDIIGWLLAHKSLIVIASIVLGMLLMASSKRSSGSYTLGVLLFIAGIGMAFYWYIIPAWHGLQNLNPLHWFK